MVFDPGDTFGNGDPREVTAAAEGIASDVGEILGKNDRCEFTAALESGLSDDDDTVGKDDRSEATAPAEGIASDLDETLGKNDRAEPTAFREGVFPDHGDPLRKSDRREATAAAEGIFSDVGGKRDFAARNLNRKETHRVEFWWKLTLCADAEVGDTHMIHIGTRRPRHHVTSTSSEGVCCAVFTVCGKFYLPRTTSATLGEREEWSPG
jgi:hypothetical protein